MPRGINEACQLVGAELERAGGQASKLSPQLRTHLRECDRCETLYGHFAGEFPAGAISPEWERQIVRKLEDSLNPVSRLRSTTAIAAEIVILFLALSAVAIAGRGSIAGIEVMNLPQLIGISTILGFGLVLLAISIAWHMTPGSLRRFSEPASIGSLCAGLVIVTGLLFSFRDSAGFAAHGWHCMRIGLALALSGAVVFAWLIRRGAVLYPRALGGTVGAIAGLLAVAVLQYTCELQNAQHLLVWHFGVFVVSTLAGAATGEISEWKWKR